MPVALAVAVAVTDTVPMRTVSPSDRPEVTMVFVPSLPPMARTRRSGLPSVPRTKTKVC